MFVLQQIESFYKTLWYKFRTRQMAQLYGKESKIRSMYKLKPIPFQCYHDRSWKKTGNF